MDPVAQQNAALVEEASAVAHSMAAQAQAMRDAVAVFKLADTGTDLSASRAVIPQSKPRLPALKTRSIARVPVKLFNATTTPPVVVGATIAAALDSTSADWQTF